MKLLQKSVNELNLFASSATKNDAKSSVTREFGHGFNYANAAELKKTPEI